MINFSLNCRSPSCGESFESWFSSGADYDRLDKAGLLACPKCASSDIGKALMAPAVAKMAESNPDRRSKVMAAFRDIRRTLERDGENVGSRFAHEARRIHAGETDERLIYGTGTAQEARELREEGVNVSSIPWVPLHDA